MAFLRVLCLSLSLSLSLSLCLSVAYVCKNCHTMTLIRGFGTPLLLLSSPRRLCSPGPLRDLMEAIYLLSLLRRFITRIYSTEQRRKKGSKEGGREISLLARKSPVAFVKIAQALRLCHRFNLQPLKERSKKVGPRWHELLPAAGQRQPGALDAESPQPRARPLDHPCTHKKD